GVLPLPIEGLPIHSLQAVEVDAPPAKGRQLLVAEVAADDADEVHGHEERCRHREERRAAAQDALGASEGRLHRVVRHAPDNQNGHSALSALSAPSADYFMYFPMIGASSRFTVSGTSSAGVTSACFSALRQPPIRGAQGKWRRAARTTSVAVA